MKFDCENLYRKVRNRYGFGLFCADIQIGSQYWQVAPKKISRLKLPNKLDFYAFLYSNNRYNFFEKLPAYSFPKIYFSIPVNSSMYFCGVIACSLT